MGEHDELVRVIRMAAESMRMHQAASFEASTLDATANAIQSLTAQVESLTAERDELISDTSSQLKAITEYAEAEAVLTASNQRLTEALETIAQEHDVSNDEYYPEFAPVNDAMTMCKIAQATLQDKGEKVDG